MLSIFANKESFKKQLEKFLEKLENEDLDLNEFNNELFETALDNKKDFKAVIYEETIKNLNNTINKMQPEKETDDRMNLTSLTESFVPDNVYKPYFESRTEDIATLVNLKNRSEFGNVISGEVKEKIEEKTKDKSYDIHILEMLELKTYMQVGMKEIIKDNLENASYEVERATGIKNYEINEEKISRGDLKALCNVIENDDIYTERDIKKDILANELLHNDKLEKKPKNFQKMYDEFEQEKKYFLEKANLNENLENFKKDIMKDCVVYGKTDIDFTKKRVETALSLDFNFFIPTEEIESLFNYTDEKKSENALPFKAISSNGELFSNKSSFENDESLKNFKNEIIDKKSEEYWDNMNLKDIRDWNNLKKDGFIEEITFEFKDSKGKEKIEVYNDEKENLYKSLSFINYLKDDFLKNEEDKVLEELSGKSKADICKALNHKETEIRDLIEDKEKLLLLDDKCKNKMFDVLHKDTIKTKEKENKKKSKAKEEKVDREIDF